MLNTKGYLEATSKRKKLNFIITPWFLVGSKLQSGGGCAAT